MLKIEQKLASIVIKFSILIYANAVFNYNILLGREDFRGVVLNKAYKSI